MYIWSGGDTALLGKAARNCGRHVSAEYRFEILPIGCSMSSQARWQLCYQYGLRPTQI